MVGVCSKKKNALIAAIVVILSVACGSIDEDSQNSSEEEDIWESPKPIQTATIQTKVTWELAEERPNIIDIKDSFFKDAKIYKKAIDAEVISGLVIFRLVSAVKGSGSLGECVFDPATGRREVRILAPPQWPEEWPSAKQFKLTVYHELGHCFLNFGHVPDNITAVMSRRGLTNASIEAANWNQLLKEFYSGQGAGTLFDGQFLSGSDGALTCDSEP